MKAGAILVAHLHVSAAVTLFSLDAGIFRRPHSAQRDIVLSSAETWGLGTLAAQQLAPPCPPHRDQISWPLLAVPVDATTLARDHSLLNVCIGSEADAGRGPVRRSAIRPRAGGPLPRCCELHHSNPLGECLRCANAVLPNTRRNRFNVLRGSHRNTLDCSICATQSEAVAGTSPS